MNWLLSKFINFGEDYQAYELTHPKKKPRGSIRRKRRIRDRRRRGYTAKEGYEISKALYEGIMEGFGIKEDTE